MRPKDENGVSLPAAHLRLAETPRLLEAALFAMAKDARASALPVKRKLALAERVIDHVVDGDATPKWVHAADPGDRNNHFLLDMWRLAEGAIAAARQVCA